MDPEIKVWTCIFPTKYVIPKSLKVSHWPSKSVLNAAHSKKETKQPENHDGEPTLQLNGFLVNPDTFHDVACPLPFTTLRLGTWYLLEVEVAYIFEN